MWSAVIHYRFDFASDSETDGNRGNQIDLPLFTSFPDPKAVMNYRTPHESLTQSIKYCDMALSTS